MKELEGMGLTKNEIKIYLALIDTGSSLAGVISRKTSIHRRTVYDAIERLIEKGLVSYIKKNNRKYFQAINPNRLKEILEEKQNTLNKVIPKLQQRFNLKKQKPETLFFRGRKAVMSAFEDQIKEGKEILIFGASPQANKVLRFYFPYYDKKRIKKKIKAKIIFDSTAKNKIKKIPLAQIKYLPRNYATPAATNIYGNKVIIVLWSENPLAILINQKEIAESYRIYFNILWKTAKS